MMESPSVLDFGADATGAKESLPAFQSGVTATAAIHSCLYVPPGTYKLSGGITGPALGQACLWAHHNGNLPAGTVASVPASAAPLIEYTAGARMITLNGTGNLIDGLDWTVAPAVTGVTAIYATDTAKQPFTNNRIVNNTMRRYYKDREQGAYLAAGLDVESIGPNSNFNAFKGNSVQLATVAYILHGATSGAVVNANDFDNEASNNSTAAQLTYAGENTFTLAMEGNKNAVLAVGVCCTNFYLDRGEQAYPHLVLSGGSHDNILWESRRGMTSGSDSAITVTPDSYPNSEMDQGSFWFGVSPAVAGRRFFCLGCIGATATYKGDLAALQLMTDRTGNRSAFRIAEAATNPDVVSDFSISPNGKILSAIPTCSFRTQHYLIPACPFTLLTSATPRAQSRVFSGDTAWGGALLWVI
jgi:hypothetical protein